MVLFVSTPLIFVAHSWNISCIFSKKLVFVTISYNTGEVINLKNAIEADFFLLVYLLDQKVNSTFSTYFICQQKLMGLVKCQEK